MLVAGAARLHWSEDGWQEIEGDAEPPANVSRAHITSPRTTAFAEHPLSRTAVYLKQQVGIRRSSVSTPSALRTQRPRNLKTLLPRQHKETLNAQQTSPLIQQYLRLNT
jgi:hypothetical protein